MAEPMTSRCHRFGNGPQRLSLSPQRDYFADRLLLGLIRNKLATPEPEGDFASEIGVIVESSRNPTLRDIEVGRVFTIAACFAWRFRQWLD
jgi:hypothetical protein